MALSCPLPVGLSLWSTSQRSNVLEGPGLVDPSGSTRPLGLVVGLVDRVLVYDFDYCLSCLPHVSRKRLKFNVEFPGYEKLFDFTTNALPSQTDNDPTGIDPTPPGVPPRHRLHRHPAEM